MKKGSKLASIVTGAALVVAPTISGYAQAPQESVMPLKGNTYVSTNMVPVKNLKKTIDYQTLKPVEELQEETVSYMDRSEGIQMGYSYVPSEDKLYDKPSSEKIIEYQMENTTSFYGDQALNPFVQPNYENAGEFHLSYYGSGNVAGDNGTINDVLNWDDYNAILGSTMEEADVDGDGNPGTQADKNMLESYLTDQIPYLPAHYELNKTTSEKESWFENYYINVEQSNTIPPVGGWGCAQYAMQFHTNSSGIENISGAFNYPSVYDTIDNFQGNMMVYETNTRSENNVGHAINAILVGENPTNFNDWYFYEPQNDTRVYPGTPSMEPNSFANIKKYVYFWSDFLSQYIYDMLPVINFDLNNGNASVTFQHPDLVTSKPSKLNYIHIGGQKPSDATVNVEDGLNPSVTGEATGYADWATSYYSDDSTTQAGGNWDSTFYNYDLFRSWWAKSDSNNIIDTTYASINPIYNRPAQIITVQDTAKPIFTYIYNGTSMIYTEWVANGIPFSEGSDNSGVFAIDRQNIAGPGPAGTCSAYEFTDVKRDSIYDPSHNWRVTEISTPIEMNPNYWDYFPYNWSLYYKDEIIPANTGGLPTADNPIPEVEVFTNQNPPMINSTYDPDSLSAQHYNWQFDWAHEANDTLCYNSIEGLQHVNVYKPNALVTTSFPESPLYIGKNDPVGPPFTGEPTYQDTLENWWPTYYNHWIELDSVSPTDSIFNIYFTGHEDITGTQTPDSVQVVVKDRDVGINENGLEKWTKDIFLPYPNPTHSGKVNVKINSMDKGLRKAYWEAYDMQGRLVDFSKKEIFHKMDEFQIDLSGHEKGEYLIRFICRGNVIQSITLIYR